MADAVWSYLVENVTVKGGGYELPIGAMRHEPTGVVFYMTDPLTSVAHLIPVCSYHRDTKLGRGWNSQRMEQQARAEYERLLAAGEISHHCEFCLIEGPAFVRGLCPACLMKCWICHEPATVSEIPSENYRNGEPWALSPRTLCAGCFTEIELEQGSLLPETTRYPPGMPYDDPGITDDDIPF